MAEAKTKAASTEEQKATLPAGHPQAGYVPPDLSAIDGYAEPPEEPTPDEAEEADKPLTREENIAAREEAVKAVEESEDKAAKEEVKAREEYAEKLAKARDAQVEKQVASGQIAEPVTRPEEQPKGSKS